MKDMLEQQLERNAKLIANVRPEQMSGSTPCKEYDCRALINHMVGGALNFTELARGKDVDRPELPPDRIGDDPSGAFAAARKGLIAAVRDPAFDARTINFPFASMPAPMAVAIMLTETVVHGWDLAKATGQDTSIDAEIAITLLPGAQMIGPEMRNPEGNPFAPMVEVPEDAPPGAKLVAAYGRTP